MSADSRVHPRFTLVAKADVMGLEVVLGRPVADLSLGGCRFHGKGWEPPGTEVEIVLSFDAASASLPVHGVVVRATNRDMGIVFRNLSDEQKWALRKYLRDAQRTATG